ncbi:MAG: oxidoreductase, partial [Candidatus Riflebacteria bacterium RBG_13_59_9]
MEAPKQKLKLAFYWAASCGGCEISLLEIGAKILNVVEVADLVFCPCLVDTKYKDVEAMPDGFLDVTFFNGAIRSSENEHIAHLLRQKSKVLIAYGSCAKDGGIPSLANLFTLEEIKHRAYHETQSTVNPDGVEPMPECSVNGYDLHLPTLYNTVWKLSDVVKVDFVIPGCAPAADTVWNAIEQLLTGNLPEPGGVLGAGRKAVCEECPYEKKETRITGFKRPHTFIPPDKEQCLLEQGLVCMGPATRSGCGAQCLQCGMPCRGCYGRLPEVQDQGAKVIAAIGSMIQSVD